ncbi:MAG: ISNCY family transposase [Treponema sp.]|nr:ISNCY family transposase [Treponema sp.]
MDEKKLEVMKMVGDGERSISWAAAKLKRSEKTIRRYRKELLENPNADLVHKNRGREPANKADHELIWNLYCTKYYGMNITFFCEKLEENENIKISEGLVRLIFKEHDEFSVRAWHRTKNELRKRLRELKKLTKQQKEVLVQLEAEPYIRTTHPTQPRSKYFGEELQMDASIHLWFGTKKSALHTAIDDATGIIVGAWFDYQETRNGYYQITKQFLTKYGLPLLIKTDKRTVFEYKRKNEKDMAEDTMTQYQHVCQTLGIELQCSSSPQFKPRVERSYGTLQGRLPFELKEAGVTTIEEANVFLKKYIQKFNEQFAIRKGIKSVWVKVTKDQIDSALVTIAKRTVDCGNGIRLNNKYYGTFDSYGNQIFIKPKTKVSVITMMNGAVYVMHDDKLLAMDIIPERQKISDMIDFDMEKPVVRKKYIPPYDSIWRITNSNLFRKKTLIF